MTIVEDVAMTLSLRVPAWASSARLAVNGVDEPVAPGYAGVTRELRGGRHR